MYKTINSFHILPMTGVIFLQLLRCIRMLKELNTALWTFLYLSLISSNLHALESVTVQLKWFHQFQFAGYYAALEQGYYQDEGLEVTLQERSTQSDPVEDVLEGRADYGITDVGLVLAALQGKPVVLISQIFQHSPWAVRILEESDINFYGDNLFTSREEVLKHPQRVERIRRATLKGWRYAIEHPDQIIDLILKKYNTINQTRAHLEYQARETRRMLDHDFVEIGYYDPERFNRIAKIYELWGLAKNGQLENSFFYKPRPFKLTAEEAEYLQNLGTLQVPLIDFQPPLSFDRAGEPAGYLNELLDYVTTALDLSINRVRGLSFSESIISLSNGDVDLLNDYSEGNIPRDGILHTIPVLAIPFVVIGRKDSDPVRSVSDLLGKRIVAVTGFQQTRALQEKYPDLKLLLVDGIDQAYRALRSDDADFYIDNATHAGYRLRSGIFSDLGVVGELPVDDISMLYLHFAAAQKHPLLHSAVEKVLRSMPNQVLRAMRDRWFHQEADNVEPLHLSLQEQEWLARHPVIRVALDPAWAPIEYRDDKGVYRGVSVDYLDRLQNILGIKFQIAKELTWQEAVQKMKNHDVDMFTSVALTAERQDYLEFTEPYVHLPIRIYARDDVSYIGGLENMSDRSVAITGGYAIEDWLRRDYPELNLIPVDTPLDALELVSSGKVDVFVGNMVIASYYLGKAGIQNVRIAGDTDYENSQSMAVRDDWPILANILDKALDRIPQSERDSIFNTWMSVRFETAFDYRLMWQLISFAGLVILVVLYWNSRLAAEINRRKQVESDLIEHKSLLEERVKERTAELREAAAVFANTAEGVAITDLQGMILNVNEAFTRITGYSRAEIIGKSPRVLSSGRHPKLYYRSMWNSLVKTGQWRGEVWNRRRDGSIYPQLLTISSVLDDNQQPHRYVGVFADISALKESEERLTYLAHHDALTGLPNRLLFNERLKHSIKRAARQNSGLALVFIDLDRFKHVNDTIGHKAGDKLLVKLALRLRNTVRSEDTISRISGDEFIVLLEGIATSEQATVAVEKLMTAFNNHFDLEGKLVNMTASMGISLYPHDGVDGEALLRNADSAMYKAKEDGRNTYQFYTREMTTQMHDYMFIKNALGTALKQGEFHLVYQPQVELISGEVVGVEALLRWAHPEQGNISPARFIPVAEQSGLIRDIGEWVLHSACKQARGWLDVGCEFGRIAVNVAGLQLQGGDYLERISQALKEYDLPATSLELELTESYLIRLADEIIAKLEGLRTLGVSIAIDDFGTGYSSLSYLKRLPVNKLKIDKSFVQDIPSDKDNMAICKSVIAMGHALNLQVIAEGVETPEQAKFLRDNTCTLAQGYLFGKPVLPEELLTQFLKSL
jgi:diguanylate cyclase (GGDEF)-like protein/PAS domain S-box-containing protein